jgi:hypothetical protein
MIRTKRQRMRRKQRLEVARRRNHDPRGKAIDGGIRKLTEIDGWQDRPIVLLDRVSTPAQRSNGNLDQAQAETTATLRALGYRGTIKRVKGVEGSRILDDRPRLLRAVELARERGGIVVAHFRDRLLRSKDFDGSLALETPTTAEFKNFKRQFKADFATLVDPDLPESEVRRMQTRRGHRSRDAKPGRPKRRKYGPHYSTYDLARVGRLLERGFSLGQIARRMKRPRPTIQSWVNRLKGAV